MYCEGKGLRASSCDSHHDNRPWGGKGASYTEKSRPGLGPTPNVDREKRKEKKLVALPKLGCLATYIGYLSRVSTSLC
jgi:hypothetical protein